MLKFISFGSGSSGNCYCLYTEQEGLLIDAGVGIRTLKKHIKNYGLSLNNMHNLLITHDHADHIKSAGWLSIDPGVNVYATQNVHQGIENNYCVRKKVASEHIKIIKANVPFNIGEYHITPFQVPHDSTDNMGYKIVYHNITFVLITDAGHITPDMQHFINEANYLVIEANHDPTMLTQGPYPAHLKERILSPNGHLSNQACGEALAQCATPALKNVWLCHLSEENNHPVLAQKTIEDILKAHGIITGIDFHLEVLKRKVPSGYKELI